MSNFLHKIFGGQNGINYMEVMIMDTEILYERIVSDKEIDEYTDYYIITESISAKYCDLKCYGVRIVKTTIYDGGGKTIESQQMNNVFYRYGDVNEFISRAVQKKVEPKDLRGFTEKYILEGLDRAKQKI